MRKEIAIIYSPDARKDLQSLDKKKALRIVKKIGENIEIDDILVRAKPLSGVLAGNYRYRIGDYRAIFSLNKEDGVHVVHILRIKHRREVYKGVL